MNFSVIRTILGTVLCCEGVFLLAPVLVAVIYGEQAVLYYVAVAAACFFAGAWIRFKRPKNGVFYSREGFVAVTFSWVLLSMAGALPMYLTGEYASYIDALFDTISGFTTTGASVLSSVEELSRATAFWRCFTHWSGGMGVLVFLMAVLPLSGNSNMHLMRAESPGPSVGKLVPKVRQTALILYKIYLAITAVEAAALMLAGLSLYEALTLTFSTVGTGGFALLNSSIASYSWAVQVIIIVFMLLCALNFNTYYLLLIRKPKEALLQNTEVQCFLVVVFLSAGVIAFNIRGGFHSIWEAFHTALFQVATIVSSTGFATADFNLWPELSKTILVLLMFMGACAGSTGGGFKVSRLLIVARAARNELLSMSHPRSVQKVSLNGRRVPDSVVKTALCYMTVYVFVVLLSVLLISIDNFDMTTNLTAVLATLNNIGPGLNVVGPSGNFGGYSVFSKIVLMFDMLVGRLELFPVLTLIAPGMWSLPKAGRSRKEFRSLDEQDGWSLPKTGHGRKGFRRM